MDLFGLKAWFQEMKAEKEKAMLAKKRAYQERKEKILSFITTYRKKIEEVELAKVAEMRKEAEAINSECPLCHSHEVIHTVKSVYVPDAHTVENRTFSVNKCKQCENEWEIKSADVNYEERSAFNPIFCQLLVHKIENYFNIEYNPKDLTEEFNSLAEKREDFIKRTQSAWYNLKFYSHFPRYMIEHVIYIGATRDYYDYSICEKLGITKHVDSYSFTLSNEHWDIIKRIIGIKTYD